MTDSISNTPPLDKLAEDPAKPKPFRRAGLWPADFDQGRILAIMKTEADARGFGWPVVARALLAHGLWVGLPTLATTSAALGPLVFAATGTAAALVLARETRALENIVHWASHDAFDPRHRRRNDILGNLLAAIPVGQRVGAFRRGHIGAHHQRTFTAEDPCGDRMRKHGDVVRGALPALWETLLRTPFDAIEFYRTVGSRPSMLAGWAAWQAVAVYAPLALMFGPGRAAITYLLVASLAQLFLAVVRSLAEAGEHDYREPPSSEPVLARTFDNLGIGGLLLHPAWDDRHWAHHAAMSARPWRLRALMKRMLTGLPAVGRLARVRYGLLDEPRPYGAANDNLAIGPREPVNDNEPAGGYDQEAS